jgi:hypothetical protein
MNEFLPRTEPVAPLSSTPERLPAGVRAVASVAASSADAAAGSARAPRATLGRGGAFAVVDDDRVRAASAYAEVHARIVTVLADLQGQSAPDRAASLAAAEGSLMPQPAVVVPLPPANREMVEFVAQVTQSIARQAAQTRAAQSGVSAAMVDIAVA